MATQTALTLDQFLALPETEDGTHYELSEGELITLPPPGYRHGVIEANIAGILRAKLDRKKYIIAGGDAGFILKSEPGSATVRGADVAVNKRETIGTIPETGYLAQAPLLAVEVVSPSNTAMDMERKVSQYLSAGTWTSGFSIRIRRGCTSTFTALARQRSINTSRALPAFWGATSK